MLAEDAWQRVLKTAAGLFLGAGAVIVLVVIPAVKHDPDPSSTPEKAIPAFVVNVFVQALAAALAILAARRGGKQARVALSVAALLGAVLGLFLLDAADAYEGHGLAMRKATLALWVCVIADWCAGLASLVGAFARDRHKA